MEKKNKKEVSELRQDPITRDWVIISTGRSKRPESFRSSNIATTETPINLCPFENPQEHGNESVKKYASAQVIRNKFPIFNGENCILESRRGPYLAKETAGYHEVVVFKDHRKSFAQMTTGEAEDILNVYRERYLDLKNKECANYILIIHNHGREAGASISHPHSQILALSFVPADIRRSLEGSRMYQKERARCAHCDILSWEQKEKKRIIFENESMVVLAPYAPKFSYEVRIFPKEHRPYFENSTNSEIKDLAEALKVSLAKIYHGLGNPSYNFFVHTPPADREQDYDYYHWHLEIAPRLNFWGGFELGTGGDVIDVDPDEAAEFLRKIKV